MKRAKILLFIFLSFRVLRGFYTDMELGNGVKNFIFHYGGVSYLKGSYAIGINPAGIAGEKKNWIYLSHSNWIFDSQIESINLGYSLNRKVTFGIYFNYFSTKDFDIIDEFGDKSGNVNYYSLNYGFQTGIILNSFAFGISFKFLNLNILTHNFLFNTDIGFKFPKDDKRLNFGLNIKNILGSINIVEGKIKQTETELICGLSYKISKKFIILFGSNFKSQYNFGIDFNLGKSFNINIGYNLGDLNYWGLGISYNFSKDLNKKVFDIGFIKNISVKDDLGTPFKIGFLYEF